MDRRARIARREDKGVTMATNSQRHSAGASPTASLALTEMREFASFSAAAQRYIKRALDIGLARDDAFRHWARCADEAESIRRHYAAYRGLGAAREALAEADEDDGAALMGPLLALASFDLGEERLDGFPPFRFLYERLLGSAVRPWLPAAFCGAAAMPMIAPPRRKALLQSISEAAATAPGWSLRTPVFVPEWVEWPAGGVSG